MGLYNNTKALTGAFLLFLPLLVMMQSCPVTFLQPSVQMPGASTAVQNSDLFVKDEDSGVVSFSTSDEAYIGEYGYTLWTEEPEVFTPFVRLNVTLSKISGDEYAGYGVVFCSSEETMLVLLINTKKEYLIGKLTGNAFTPMPGWEESPDLLSGYNRTNTVDITRDPESGSFKVSFNGGKPVTFRDDEDPFLTGGRNGFMAVISPRDNFPEVPVNVTFKVNQES